MTSSHCIIDIGEEYIKVLDGARTKDQFTIHAAAYERTPPNLFRAESADSVTQASQVVIKLIKDAGINKKDAVIILPDSMSYTRILSMPLLTEKELISAIRYQADQFIPVPIDKISLDIETLERDTKEKKLSILLVAAGNNIIEKTTTIIESAGLIPMSLENETSASLRLLKEYSSQFIAENNSGFILLINVSNLATSLILIDRVKKTPIETHSFTLGIEILRKDIRTNYNLDDAKIQSILFDVGFLQNANQYNLHTVLQTPLAAFADELKRFLMSLRDRMQGSATTGLLYGEGALIPGFDTEVAKLVGIPIQSIPFDRFVQKNTVSEFFHKDLPLFVPAMGAAV